MRTLKSMNVRIGKLLVGLILVTSCVLFLLVYGNYFGEVFLNINGAYGLVIQFLLIYTLAHIMRILRLYVLLVESKVRFDHLMREYALTTWVNTLIPFKIGEFFRIYRFGKLTGKMEQGVAVVWVERIFDGTILLAFYFAVLLYGGGIGEYLPVILFLLVFVFFSFIFHLEFSSTYKYINNLIMSKSKTTKGLFLFKKLEIGRNLHVETKRVLQGRLSFLLLTSLIIWVLEIVGFTIITRAIVVKTSIINEFLSLLNESFVFGSGYSSMVQQTYIILSLSLLVVLMIFSYIVFQVFSKKKRVGVRIDA